MVRKTNTINQPLQNYYTNTRQYLESRSISYNKNQYKVDEDTVKDAKPSIVPSSDKEKYWNLLTAVYPTFNLYRSKTDRDIPLVKLITE